MKNIHNSLSKVSLLLIALLIPILLLSQNHSESYLIKKADRIHKRILSIDTHNDSALRLNNPDPAKPRAIQVTFPYMKE